MIIVCLSSIELEQGCRGFYLNVLQKSRSWNKACRQAHLCKNQLKFQCTDLAIFETLTIFGIFLEQHLQIIEVTFSFFIAFHQFFFKFSQPLLNWKYWAYKDSFILIRAVSSSYLPWILSAGAIDLNNCFIIAPYYYPWIIGSFKPSSRTFLQIQEVNCTNCTNMTDT